MNHTPTLKTLNVCRGSVRLWNTSVQGEKYELIRINDYFLTPKWRVSTYYRDEL